MAMSERFWEEGEGEDGLTSSGRDEGGKGAERWKTKE